MKNFMVVTLLGLTLCAGCQSPTAADEWTAEYEAAWQDVLSCWQSKGLDTRKARRPGVIVRGDCQPASGGEIFRSGGDWFHGLYYAGPNDVEVCPDLSALRHEMSHALLATVAGNAGENGIGGCYSVVQ